MLKVPAFLTLGALALFTGCGPASLYPLVTAEEAAPVNSASLGLWKACHDKDLWKIEASGDRAYTFRQLDEGDTKGRIRLIKLEGQWFADIEPDGGIVPGHLFAKLRLEDDTVHMAFLKEAPAVKALRHESVPSADDRETVLTAP